MICGSISACNCLHMPRSENLDVNDLADGDLAVFIRLGSDYKNNYYEYEVPLKLTPHGEYNYNNSEHQKIVWPAENMLNFVWRF